MDKTDELIKKEELKYPNDAFLELLALRAFGPFTM